jgi:hypothetical protein
MHPKATKANTPRRWRPLSQAQLNAIDCLLAGMNDTETAADPRVNTCRQTVWDWKMYDLLFIAELQQRRASLWASTCEKLRGLLGKAIVNISASIESSNVADSWNLLKCVGLFGDGTGNAVHGAHIEHELRQRATNQARSEYDLLIQDHSPTASMKRLDWNEAARVEEILEELLDEYTDPDEG